MTTQKLEKVCSAQWAQCQQLLQAKGKEYAGETSDRLSAFRTAGALQGVSAKRALAGMFAKHVVSIFDMCAGGVYPEARWNEKITDSINYLLLLQALVTEERNG